MVVVGLAAVGAVGDGCWSEYSLEKYVNAPPKWQRGATKARVTMPLERSTTGKGDGITQTPNDPKHSFQTT